MVDKSSGASSFFFLFLSLFHSHDFQIPSRLCAWRRCLASCCFAAPSFHTLFCLEARANPATDASARHAFNVHLSTPILQSRLPARCILIIGQLSHSTLAVDALVKTGQSTLLSTRYTTVKPRRRDSRGFLREPLDSSSPMLFSTQSRF